MKRNFARRWDKVFKEAGLEGLTRHDLRRTAVTNLADAGCTNAEIASITGHSQKSIDEIIKYYLVRTTKQAKSAIAKLEKATRDSGKEKK